MPTLSAQLTQTYFLSFEKENMPEGVKFRRQEPIKEYIVDFVSFQPKLIIELDGGQHADAVEADSLRDGRLTDLGFRVLRFWNNAVFENLDGVLEVVRANCTHPQPPPVEGGSTEATFMFFQEVEA